MASIPFVKATACGNDFLLIDFAHAPSDIYAFTKRICDRHYGIGADGVEWLLPATDADIRVRLLNSDGSEAEISGNGTRCVAAWYCAENQRNSVVIRTGAGLKTCELKARDGNTFQFRSSMGEPEVGDDFSIKFTYGEISGTPVSMGNPHFVVFVPEFELGWQAIAEQISKHHDFQAWNERRIREGRESRRDRRAFLRAGCRRDHVVRYRFLCCGCGGDPPGKGDFASAGASSRRRADRGMGRSSPPDWTGDATLSRRIFHLR